MISCDWSSDVCSSDLLPLTHVFINLDAAELPEVTYEVNEHNKSPIIC